MQQQMLPFSNDQVGVVGAVIRAADGVSVEALRHAFTVGVERVIALDNPPTRVDEQLRLFVRQVSWALAPLRPCGRLALAFTNGELRLSVNNGDVACRWPVVARWRSTGEWRHFESTALRYL